MKFDEPAAGNFLKNRLHGLLKEFVAIKAMVQHFPHKKGKAIVTVEIEWSPGILVMQ